MSLQHTLKNESEWIGLQSDRAVPDTLRRYLRLAMASVLLLFVWAAFAELDEVTHSTGQVVPSGRVQTIQHLEGGIVESILVDEGERVTEGQVLATLNGGDVTALLAEKVAARRDIETQLTRLQAEHAGITPSYSQEIRQAEPTLVEAQLDLFAKRQEGRKTEETILQQRLQQKQRFIEELQSRHSTAKASATLAHKELDMSQRLVKQQVMSEVEFLRLQRAVNDMDGEIAELSLQIKQARLAVSELENQIQDRENQYQSEIAETSGRLEAQRVGLNAGIAELNKRSGRLQIRSPVDGIIKDININTLGGVVAPGEAIMTIVPYNAKLVVEARVHPRDIGYVSIGQPALVKVSAFDYRRYGGLEGHVIRISPDSLLDEYNNPYYRIMIETDRDWLGSESDPRVIVSGMTTTVDITTGYRTVLEYLAKPFLDVHDVALTEH